MRRFLMNIWNCMRQMFPWKLHSWLSVDSLWHESRLATFHLVCLLLLATPALLQNLLIPERRVCFCSLTRIFPFQSTIKSLQFCSPPSNPISYNHLLFTIALHSPITNMARTKKITQHDIHIFSFHCWSIIRSAPSSRSNRVSSYVFSIWQIHLFISWLQRLAATCWKYPPVST